MSANPVSAAAPTQKPATPATIAPLFGSTITVNGEKPKFDKAGFIDVPKGATIQITSPKFPAGTLNQGYSVTLQNATGSVLASQAELTSKWTMTEKTKSSAPAGTRGGPEQVVYTFVSPKDADGKGLAVTFEHAGQKKTTSFMTMAAQETPVRRAPSTNPPAIGTSAGAVAAQAAAAQVAAKKAAE